MNEILAKLEDLSMDDLTYLFEYLVDLINERKLQEVGTKNAGICDNKRF